MRQYIGYGIFAVPLVFLAIFFFHPLISILRLSFFADGQLDLTGFARIISTRLFRQTLWFTFWQAFVSTTLTIVIAIPVAFVFTRFEFSGKRMLMSLSTLPFVLPTVVVATAFSSLIGDRGVINDLIQTIFNLDEAFVQLEGTIWIILIVHVFYNFAIAFRIIAGYWSNQGFRLEDAGRALGANEWKLWWYVRLPAIRPALIASFILVFIFNFTSFGVVLILGQSRFATVEVEIYLQAISFFDLPIAGALSVVQIITMILMMVVYTRIQRNITVELRKNPSRRPRNTREKVIIFLTLLFLGLMLFTPLLALIVRSLSLTSISSTFQPYADLFSESNVPALQIKPISAVWNSLFIAVITTIMAVSLGVLSAYLLVMGKKRWLRLLDPLFMLPLATSAVTLGFGFIIALDEPPLNLRTSPILIPIAHTLVATPFVVRSVLPTLQSIPSSVLESAKVLGATPFRVFKLVEFPMIRGSLIVGATFAFTISMGEFGASLFIARPEIPPTIPIVIYRMLSYPIGNAYEQALAMSVILMMVCAVGFMLIDRVRAVGVGEF